MKWCFTGSGLAPVQSKRFLHISALCRRVRQPCVRGVPLFLRPWHSQSAMQRGHRHHPLLLRNHIFQYLLARLCNARHLLTDRALGDVSCQVVPFRVVRRRKNSSKPFENGDSSICTKGMSSLLGQPASAASRTGAHVFCE
jgi:hypothetical protein